MQGDRASALAGETAVVHHPQFPDVSYQVAFDKVKDWTDQGWVETKDEAARARAHPIPLVPPEPEPGPESKKK